VKREQLVVTNIRLPKDDLLEYRQLALEEGKKFPTWLRGIMRQYMESRQRREAMSP
jgi:hypothetical protein